MENKERVIIIGDVHGCKEELEELLIKNDYNPQTDRVILVGDIVGKGPDSPGCIEFCMKNKIESVMGNWDFHWLNWYEKEKGPENKRDKSKEEREDYKGIQLLKEEHWDWFKQLPIYIHIEKYNLVVVHAGLEPNKELKAQKKEMVMFLRCIDSHGKPSKEFLGEEHLWAKKWNGPYFVLFGHDAARKLQVEKSAIGLDTGCVYGGKLTAFIFPDKKLVHVDAKKVYSPPKDKSSL